MKNISIKNFEKAKRIHKEIVAIDFQILQIEKIANEISSGDHKIKIGIEVEKPITESVAEINPLENNDFLKHFFGYGFRPIKPVEPKDTTQFTFSESECLKVLSTLLQVKYYTRKELIKKLS